MYVVLKSPNSNMRSFCQKIEAILYIFLLGKNWKKNFNKIVTVHAVAVTSLILMTGWRTPWIMDKVSTKGLWTQ